MNNLYDEVYDQINGVSNFKGKIKSIMDKCVDDMIEAKDIYNEQSLWKYQERILNKALNEIGNVMKQGYQALGTELEKAIAKLPAENPNPVYNVNDLVKMQRLQMQMNCMTDEQVEQVLNNNITDSFIVDITKNELMNRSKLIEDKEERAERQMLVRSIQPLTKDVIATNCKKQYSQLGADVNNPDLLWGMSYGERLAIHEAGGVRQMMINKAGVKEPVLNDDLSSKYNNQQQYR